MKLMTITDEQLRTLAIFTGIVLIGLGLGLGFDLGWPGFLIGLGVALVYLGRGLQVERT